MGRYIPLFAELSFCLPNFFGIVGLVNPDWQRLGKRVLARRTSRGWSQTAVAKRGGPSDTLQSQIERGEWRPSRGVNDTLKKIDAGLLWAEGSASIVLEGGEPTPVDDERLGSGTVSQSQRADRRPDPVALASLSWKTLRDAAKRSRQDDSDAAHQRIIVELLLEVLDILTEQILSSNAGKRARPVLQEFFTDENQLRAEHARLSQSLHAHAVPFVKDRDYDEGDLSLPAPEVHHVPETTSVLPDLVEDSEDSTGFGGSPGVRGNVEQDGPDAAAEG
ncbi:helix-turn-helix domain-containing protein [Mycobacterium sp. C3-094]